jgi:hypothetical protein
MLTNKMFLFFKTNSPEEKRHFMAKSEVDHQPVAEAKQPVSEAKQPMSEAKQPVSEVRRRCVLLKLKAVSICFLCENLCKHLPKECPMLYSNGAQNIRGQNVRGQNVRGQNVRGRCFYGQKYHHVIRISALLTFSMLKKKFEVRSQSCNRD